jgi:hypothetical protein
MLAELDGEALILRQQAVEPLPSLDEGQPAQILAILKQQIEGKHHQAVGSALNGGSQGCEVGEAILVLDDDLSIDQG